ncbi:MAG: porin [Phaeodactylibacter sp.]|nr:porin [Phaeodactylibacter sp.]MCB9275490.1 porin [Lewinellaceae bacterium]
MRVLKCTLSLLMFFEIWSFALYAQEATLVADKPAMAESVATEAEPEPEKPALPFTISGFVDAYYAYSFTESALPTSFTDAQNSFSLGMANVAISREGKVGFMVDLAVGPRAEVANGFSGTTLSAIKQLYVTYNPADWVKFTFGNFSTFVGYELIDAPGNINYSTSYMFSNGPFYHTGLKADFSLSEHIGFMAGVFDDTDSKIDFTPGKHIGAQLSYTGDDYGIFLNYLGGKNVEGDSISPSITGHQFDITATYQLTEKLGLGLNATSKANVMSEGDNTSWYGAALYANYAFSDAFTLGLRGEYIGDPDGLILGLPDDNVISLTISGNFHVGPLTIIPEFRADMAAEEAYTDADGKFTKALPVALLAAVYAF